jgi:hypothetical protein
MTRTFENPAAVNFLELRTCELRRIPLPRTPVNGHIAAPVFYALGADVRLGTRALYDETLE